MTTPLAKSFEILRDKSGTPSAIAFQGRKVDELAEDSRTEEAAAEVVATMGQLLLHSVEFLLRLADAEGVVNCLEICLADPATGARLGVISVTKGGGKTPLELRQEALQMLADMGVKP